MGNEKTTEFQHYREILPHHLERLRDSAHVAKITSPKFKQWFGDWEGGSDHSKVIHPLTAYPAETMQIDGTNIPVSQDRQDLVRGSPGAPRPVFHGTSLGGYDRYSTQFMNPKNLMGPGFYHTEDPELANTYTRAVNAVAGSVGRPQVQMGYMDLRNPFDADHGLRLQLARANDSMRPMIDPALPAWKKIALWFSALRDKEFVSQAGRFRIPFGVPGVPLPPAFSPREDHPQETFGEMAAKFNAKAGKAPGDPYGKQAAHEHLQRLGFDGITHTGGIYVTPMGQAATNGRIHRVWIGFRPNQFKHIDNTGEFNPQDDRFHYGHDGLGVSELVQRMRELGLSHGGRELAARLVEFLNRNPHMRANVSMADLALIHAWGSGLVRYAADMHDGTPPTVAPTHGDPLDDADLAELRQGSPSSHHLGLDEHEKPSLLLRRLEFGESPAPGLYITTYRPVGNRWHLFHSTPHGEPGDFDFTRFDAAGQELFPGYDRSRWADMEMFHGNLNGRELHDAELRRHENWARDAADAWNRRQPDWRPSEIVPEDYYMGYSADFEAKHPRDEGGKFTALNTAREHIERHKGRGGDSSELASQLAKLTRAQLDLLKKEHGLWAGGNKQQLVAKLSVQITRRVTAKEHWKREARKAGLSYKSLQAEAHAYRESANQGLEDVARLIRRAKDLYKHYNGKALTKAHKAFVDGDADMLPRFDEIVDALAREDEFRGLLNGDYAHNEAALYDYLANGRPKPISLDDARGHVLQWAESAKLDIWNEPIPFERPQ